jgi:hypothetical protein
VQAAYEAMAEEEKAQYQALIDSGLKVEFIDPKPDPYGNPRNAILDVREQQPRASSTSSRRSRTSTRRPMGCCACPRARPVPSKCSCAAAS